MASNTRITWNRRSRKRSNNGRKRKAVESKRSTPSAADLFAALGEPGKPAPAAKPAVKPAVKT
jgi:hypothetical protein